MKISKFEPFVVMAVINKVLTDNEADTIRGYLYCDCIDALRKLEESNIQIINAKKKEQQ